MASRPDRFLFPQPNNSTCLDGIFLCPPPVPPSSYDPSTTIHFRHSSLLPALPAAAASLVAAATLSLLLALFLLRRRRRRRHGGNAALDDPSADEPLEEQQGGGDDGEVEHHVWYIRTVGLDESTIRAITAWAYKAGDGVLGASAADCAVCLSDFRDGELVRLLPKCGHTFHLSCIDTWLRSHVNCPLCRAPVAAPISAVNNGGSETRTPSSSSSSSLSSTSSSSLSSRELAVDHVDPNSVSSALGDSNQINGQQIEAGQSALQEEMEGERLELGARSRTVVDSIPISELQVAIDIGEDGFQPIRRSVSMDSYACAPSMHRLESEEGQSDNKKEPTSEEERHNRTRGKQGNASSITSLHKERSSTSASGRFFLSRHGRAWSSVLPL